MNINESGMEDVLSEKRGRAPDGEVKISVVIPVYNAAKTLEYTVGSILSPSFFDSCELILVDDGSTDGSQEACDGIARMSGRIHVVHKQNGGVSSARNAGMAAASGLYLTFVDSDDLLPAGCLAEWLDTLSAENPADLYVGGYRLSGSAPSGNEPVDSRVYGKDSLGVFIDDNHSDSGSYMRPVWGKLFRKSVIDRLGLRFEPGLSYGEDVLFLYRFLLGCDSAGTVPRCTYIYRAGMSGLSSDLSSDRHLGQLMMLLQPYSGTIREMERRFPGSVTVSHVYHRDFVGRLICRLLTVFATRRTSMCNSDNISRLYHYMSGDRELSRFGGVFSLRAGQIPNLMLFRLKAPLLSAHFYRLSACICELFRIRPRRY